MPHAADTLAAYLTHLRETGSARSTVRQREWALRRVLDTVAASPAARVTSGNVTAEELVRLSAWAEAELHDEATPLPTRRAHLSAVRAFARFAGVAEQVPSLPTPPLRRLLDPPVVRAVVTLADRPLPGVLREERLRAAALVTLTAVTGVKGVQLCALRTADVDVAARSVAPAGTAPLPLPEWARDACVDWLAVRQPLVDALEGTTDALFVSVRPNHDPRTGATRPAGLPLRPRGLQRSFARVVAAANLAHAGEPGFPLPTSLTWWRRSVVPPA